MVNRNDDAARRAAQRRLASEIKEGTYQPSELGKKARETPKLHRDLVKAVIREKKSLFGDKVNVKNQRKSLDKYSNKELTRQLQKLKGTPIEQILYDLAHDGEDIDSAFHYH